MRGDDVVYEEKEAEYVPFEKLKQLMDEGWLIYDLKKAEGTDFMHLILVKSSSDAVKNTIFI